MGMLAPGGRCARAKFQSGPPGSIFGRREPRPVSRGREIPHPNDILLLAMAMCSRSWGHTVDPQVVCERNLERTRESVCVCVCVCVCDVCVCVAVLVCRLR